MANYDKLVETTKQKTKDTHDKVIKAINEMIEKGEKITYYSVNKKTGVSRAFLYKDEDVVVLIDKYKTSTGRKPKQATEAKDVIIEAQKRKIKELEKYQKDNENYKEKYEKISKENKELKKQLETAYKY